MLKDLISKMQAVLNKYRPLDSVLDEIALEGEMLIVNQKKEEIFLEIRFSKKQMFGKECYSFICENRNHKREAEKMKEIDNMRQIMVGKISHELRTPLNNIRIILQIACSYNGLPKEFIEEYIKPAL